MKTVNPMLAVLGLIAFSQAQYFNLLAAHSASPIHLSPINANGGALWIGKPQSDYCPPGISGLTCSNTTGLDTAYGGGKAGGGLSLGVRVPGGQQIFIDKACGALGYTRPHSASIPTGAYVTGWTNTPFAFFGFLDWKLNGTGEGIVFCSENGDANVGPWKAYAVLDDIELPAGACLGADLISSEVNSTSVWEYTG
ncbi:unnamed protein product [Zymoseptoria tritici ST99CH_1A5]|uniref:IgE-binding protein n=3 Tax=Zymoseptoria tritici TaxID=1047171 RepID=A0A1X7RWX5_ZYMT9|nr:unnamed protein product [Zymoseptoria tritici ST99CH_3D7]SMR54490.1 unnamed protein product [Zymoseptoria tritici ST99CH_1E4]SMR56404.1 unnamed protein product [Zymoseptoria tritici ST99CH_3D1]SMY25589.1 unnamed protein product [Zymoseptoria tritici ST99CH_1A5]